MGLRRELTLSDAVMLVVGSIVGVGIFSTTGIVAQSIPDSRWMLAAWGLGGFMALSGALTVGELGSSLPHVGGEYAYLREAYPTVVSFLYGWACFWATLSGAIAILSIALADYLSHLLPFFSLKHIIITWPFVLSWGHLLAIAVITSITVLNYFGVKLSSQLQNFLSVLKVILIIAIICLGFYSKSGSWHNLSGHTGVGLSASGFLMGLIPVWFTYSGWNAVAYMGEELKSPEKDITRACVLGILLAMFLYLLINAVYIYAMPIKTMSGVISIAQLAMTRLWGVWTSGFVSAVVVISILGCLNATVMVGARVCYAMARDGLFFESCAKLHPSHGTPVTAILAQGVWACVLLLSGTFGQLLNFTVFVMLVFSSFTGVALFRLRKMRPDMERPYRVWGYPFTPAFFILICLSVAISSLLREPTEAAMGLLVILAGLPAYRFWKVRN